MISDSSTAVGQPLRQQQVHGSKPLWAAMRTGLAYLFIIAGALFTAMPFVWMFLSSFKGQADIAAIPLRWLPTIWRPENYSMIWELMPFTRFYLNSTIIAVSQTLGVLLTASLGAYGFARINFYGRNTAFLLYLGTIMIPGWVTLIPVFKIIRDLGWLNTYQGMIVPGLTSAMATFLLRQFFMTIPSELEDAAFIDGANRLRIYWQIVMPLARPALLTVGLITFMGSWNSLLWPLVVAQSEEMQTLPLGLARLALSGGWVRIEWGALMAATLLSILPIMVIYVFLQNYFIRGIAMSGLK
ncbi:MAG: carbohydrate ABC transporter permease [Chloroflexota bacterium]